MFEEKKKGKDKRVREVIDYGRYDRGGEINKTKG